MKKNSMTIILQNKKIATNESQSIQSDTHILSGGQFET